MTKKEIYKLIFGQIQREQQISFTDSLENRLIENNILLRHILEVLIDIRDTVDERQI